MDTHFIVKGTSHLGKSRGYWNGITWVQASWDAEFIDDECDADEFVRSCESDPKYKGWVFEVIPCDPMDT